MATQHHFRLLFIVPLARVAAFNTWVRSNLDANGGDWFDRELNADGSTAAATHRWCSAGLTTAEVKKVAQRLATIANITFPARWDSMTRAEKKQWLLDQRVPLRTATGIRILAADNDGVWDNTEAELATASLARRRPESI